MSRPLRIAIVTSDIPNYRLPLLRELARRNVVVHIVAAGNLGKGFVMGALPSGVSITRLKARRLPSVRNDVIRSVLAAAPHVIVSEHGARHDYVWTTLLAPSLRRFPRVLWTHGVASQELYGGVRDAAWLGRWVQIDLADGALCYDAHGAALVRAARPHKNVGHLNNSTDGFELRRRIESLENDGRAVVRSRLGIRPEAAVICGLGRLVAAKQFARLISILSMVRRGGVDAQLVLIGDGPERDSIEQLSCDAGVREQVIFAGAVRDASDLAPWLFASDVSVSPAAIGLSVADALFAGLPTITPPPGTKGPFHGPEFRYLNPGGTALIATDDSDRSLANACLDLFARDGAAREAISNACVQFAVTTLGVERMAAAMTDFLTEVRRTWGQKYGSAGACL